MLKRLGLALFSGMLISGGLDQAQHPASKLETALKATFPLALTEDMVRLSGVSMVVASVLLQVNFLRRLTAVFIFFQLALVTWLGHRFWEHKEPQLRMQRIQFLKNLSMMGAALYIAGDR